MDMSEMKVDFQGRIRNTKLPYRQCLLPLMEAIVNSIQAIHDKDESQSGKIEVQLIRDSQLVFETEEAERKKRPIAGFSICDDGIGFTDENFDSFLTADTTHRLAQGGRGIGRFSWLKAFSEVTIESFFRDKDKIKLRKFRFCLTHRGIEDHTCEDVKDPVALKTIVSLVGFQKKYQEHCPKSTETLALRIVEHCLEFFVFGNAPNITVLDDGKPSELDLNKVFKDNFSFSKKVKSFEVKGKSFALRDVQIFRPFENDHKVNLCADKRVVLSEGIASRIPHTGGSLSDLKRGEFVYMAYVTGEYLDSIVNSERTGFDFSDMEVDLPGKEEILAAADELIEAFINPFTLESRKQAFSKTKNYVINSAPVYRYLLEKRKTEIEELPVGLSETKLDLELHKFHIEEKTEIKRESTDLLDPKNITDEDFLSKNKDRIEDLFRKLNDVVKSELAEYVLQRKVVLEYVKNLLEQKPDGGYQVEEALHRVIFPLKASSDSVDYKNHNLWIVDERLVYHEYLASDTPFSQQKEAPIQVDSANRPDIVIFNKAFALNEGGFPICSCVIVEFKRPERNEYQEEKNPIHQVLRYVDEIRNGRAKDRGGSTIEVPASIPFYCYVIASLTPKMKEFALLNSLISTHDGSGFYGYVSGYAAYVEVISFKKLIADAKKRNQAFFDKLNL